MSQLSTRSGFQASSSPQPQQQQQQQSEGCLMSIIPSSPSITTYVPKPPSLTPSRPRPSSASAGATSFGSRKKWLVNAQKILRFYAYYDFSLSNNLYGGSSIRKVVIHYYLEDDTVAVIEPQEANSGFPSGTIIKRGAYPPITPSTKASPPITSPSPALQQAISSAPPAALPQLSAASMVDKQETGATGAQVTSPPCITAACTPPSAPAAATTPTPPSADNLAATNDTNITFTDIRVGGTLIINGFTFHIYDADPFTRTYIPDLPPALPCPTGTYKTGPLVTDLTYPRFNPGQYNVRSHNPGRDQPVLVFYCTWDETWREHGGLHRYKLMFFTEDGTLELREVIPSNSSYDVTPLVLRRHKALKAKVSSRPNMSMLNPDYIGSHTFLTPDSYIGLEDLQVGKQVKIGSRDLIIDGAPEWTLQYIRDRVGVTLPSPTTGGAVDLSPWSPQKKHKLRTLISSRKAELLRRFYKGALYSGKIFRFQGRRAGAQLPEDEALRYSILYYLEGDEVSIHMTAPRNSGYDGGYLLKRSKVINPETGRPYGYRDFHVGNIIKLPPFDIEITAAEEDYQNYLRKMETPPTFPGVHDLFSRETSVSDDEIDELLKQSNNRILRGAEDRELIKALGCIQMILCDHKGVDLILGALTKRASLDAEGNPSRCVTSAALQEALKSETPLSDRGWAALGKKFPPLVNSTSLNFHTFLRVMERYQLARNMGRTLLTHL